MTFFLKRLPFYLAVIAFAVYMGYNDHSPVLAAAIVGGAFLLLFALPFYYSLLLEKNMDRLDAFLRKQHRNPALYIQYALANELSEEAKAQMSLLMRKYKRPEMQAPFKAAYGLFRHDTSAVREALRDIRQPTYRHYYEAYLYLEEGKLREARETANALAKPWMKYAMLAEAELKEGRREAALDYARKALNASKGVHYYALHREYERALPEAIQGA